MVPVKTTSNVHPASVIHSSLLTWGPLSPNGGLQEVFYSYLNLAIKLYIRY